MEPGVDLERQGAQAFAIETRIKEVCVSISTNWWELAELLYTFHEGGYWSYTDAETLDEFLAQPEIGISRALFFQMTRCWRDLVVTRGVDPETLRTLQPSKVREVVPAIVAGRVEIEEAFADVQSLGFRDLRKEYTEGEKGRGLDAGREPERVQCEGCGSWLTPEKLREWGERHGS